MSAPPLSIAWKAGSPELRARVEVWLRGEGEPGSVVSESARRRLTRIAAAATSAELPAVWLAKHFLPARAVAGPLAPLKLALGRHPAEREWRALVTLHGAGVDVPRPLGWGRLEDGGALVVMEFIEGETLLRAIESPPAHRRAVLAACGDALARLHRAGFVHRDLHVGNALVRPDSQRSVVWIDLQRADPARGAAARIRDWGQLDSSLRHAGLGIADRMRARLAALAGAESRAERAQRAQAIGRASLRHGERHLRSRTRRLFRPGRRFARARHGEWRGLRLHSISDAELERALAQHRERRGGEILKDDHRALITRTRIGERAVIVKEVLKGGMGRRLADAFRGSAARRAWRGGHGLRLRGIAAAEPLAFVERRRFGVPTESLLVMEDLGASSLDLDSRWTAEEIRRSLLPLLLRLHRQKVVHGDVQALHLYLAAEGERIVPRLIDLEGVRFPRRVNDARRIQDLAELNSSLADERMGPGERLAWFQAYCRSLPFERGELAALQAVVERSLLRRHHWLGVGCEAARRAEAVKTG